METSAVASTTMKESDGKDPWKQWVWIADKANLGEGLEDTELLRELFADRINIYSSCGHIIVSAKDHITHQQLRALMEFATFFKPHHTQNPS